jgi:Cytochrome c3
MRRQLRTLIFSFSFVVIFLAIAESKDECFTCHDATGTAEATAFHNDVHLKAGLSCASCHGGDPSSSDMETAMDPKKGFIAVPKPAEIPNICGKCHGESGRPTTQFHLKNILSDFESGAHGRAWKENAQGPQCVSCHGVHNIVKVTDQISPVYPTNVVKTCSKCHSDAEYMKKFNPALPVDQYEKYLTSIHGKRNASGDPKAATCVSCHSNHLIYAVKDPRSPVYPTNVPDTCGKCHGDAKLMAAYGIPTKQLADYKQSVHGIALLKNSDLSAPACNSCHGNHGAAPPGVSSVANVCGVCHQANADLFTNSPHGAAFEAMGVPGCVVCHSNHLVKKPEDNMIGLQAGSICSSCHSSKDKAAPVIQQIRQTLDHLNTGRQQAESELAHAEQLGMDVAEAKYTLKDVNQSLIQTRVQIHSFAIRPVGVSAAPGIKIIEQAKNTAHAAVEEYYFRRKGLGISTLILTALVALLYVKIRRIEKDQNSSRQ